MKIFFFGEDSNLARELADECDDWGYDVLNSYKHHFVSKYCSRWKQSEFAWTEELDALDSNIQRVLQSAKPDVVINCAALVNSGKCYNYEMAAYRINALAAERIAVSCRMLGIRLVHFGTTASYVTDRLIDETTSPSFFHTAYSFTKLLGEQMVQAVMSYEKLAIIRPVFVYGGKRDTSSIISTLIRRHYRQDETKIVINLSMTALKAPLYVTDFVTAVMPVIDGQHAGEFVVGQDEWVLPYGEVIALLESHGVYNTNVLWQQEQDSLGNHVPNPTKIKLLAPKGWPYVSVEEGIRKCLISLR